MTKPVLTTELHLALQAFASAHVELRRIAAHPRGATRKYDEAARRWDEAGEKVLRAADAAGIRPEGA